MHGTWFKSVDITYLLTYLLHGTVLLQKLPGFQIVKKFPTIYGTRKFITAFTSGRHLSLSWASSIQSIPLHPTSWRSILILSSHLSLSLPSGIVPSGFPTETLFKTLISPIRVTGPAHLILLDLINRTVLSEGHKSLSSSLYSFLHSPVSPSLKWLQKISSLLGGEIQCLKVEYNGRDWYILML